MQKWMGLIVGSATGGAARYLLSGVIHRIAGAGFPYGTLVVNLIGCFLVGFLSSIAEEKWVLSEDMKLLLVIGFCGAFTTFSALIVETTHLVKTGEELKALFNVLASVVLGLAIFRLGILAADIL